MAKDGKKLQSFTSFNSGEYSPSLAGRVDLQSHGSSARLLSNFMSEATGGLKKFYGTRHIAEVDFINGEDKVKFVPFVNRFEPMVLVLISRYGVIIGEDGGEVAKPIEVGLIYGESYSTLDITLPSSIDLDELSWQQINDVIIFAHKSVQPFALLFYGKEENGEYTFRPRDTLFREVPYFPIGGTNDFVGMVEASGISGTITLKIPDASMNIRSEMPSILVNQSSYVRSGITGWTSHYMTPGKGHTVNNSTIKLFRRRGGIGDVELVSGVCNTPNVSEEKDKHWSGLEYDYRFKYKFTDTVSRERILQVLKSKYPNSYLYGDQIVLIGVDDHEAGDLYYMELHVGSIIYNRNGSVVYPAADYSSVPYEPLDITFEGFNPDQMIGRKIKFYFNDDTVISPWWQGRPDIKRDQYVMSNGHWYKAMTSGTCGNIQPAHTIGIASDGGVEWQYVHSGTGTASVLSVVDDKTIKALVTEGELPCNRKNDMYVFNNYAWSIWGYKGVHPSHVYMAGSRLGFICNTEGYGAWNSLSVVDDYYNFATEQYGRQLDTSAIVNVIPNNEAGSINWVLSRKTVYMGSYTGEFSIKAPNDVFTPTTIRVDSISNMGGAFVSPLKYKDLNVFVGVTGRELYSIGYDYTIEDYAPQSLGYMTEHIMDKGIRRMAPLNNKDRNIYLLHNTQELSLFNYVKEQKIAAFSELNFDSVVLDFTSSQANEIVTGYVAVIRNEGKITFERLATDNPVFMWDTIEVKSEDGVFVPVPHYANKEVWVKYGEDLSQFVKIALDENGASDMVPESAMYQIGIPMVCELHTQPAFGNKVEGMQQQSVSLYLRLYKSGAFNYGSSVDFSKYFPYDSWPNRQELDAGRALYTGDCELNIPLGYAHADNWGDGEYPNTSAVGVNIKADTPEPFNLLSIQEIYK
jgi:hypothetical protein